MDFLLKAFASAISGIINVEKDAKNIAIKILDEFSDDEKKELSYIMFLSSDDIVKHL